MIPASLSIVDAFANGPFTGNPAAVCVLDQAADAAWMQAVASEMNLSETAFVEPADDAFGLRWFTPTAEVDLCGHATLAAAHWLWEAGIVAVGEAIRFETRSGTLICERRDGWIAMDFPSTPPVACDAPDGLLAALGVEPAAVAFAGATTADILVALADESAVRSLSPDFRALSAIETRGVIATALADSSDRDFVSRFFAPRYGIDEDPVTGSAHCALGPYWAEKLGRNDVVGYQCSRRGGTLRVAVRGGRVTLSGQAVTVMSGALTTDAGD